MRVLVCGGRDFTDRAFVQSVLDEQHAQQPFSALIYGCARGADIEGMLWARKVGVPIIPFPANWNKHGKAAGPIRNQQMLDEGKPDRVIAFSGGRGTADMVARAKKAGVPVWEVIYRPAGILKAAKVGLDVPPP